MNDEKKIQSCFKQNGFNQIRRVADRVAFNLEVTSCLENNITLMQQKHTWTDSPEKKFYYYSSKFKRHDHSAQPKKVRHLSSCFLKGWWKKSSFIACKRESAAHLCARLDDIKDYFFSGSFPFKRCSWAWGSVWGNGFFKIPITINAGGKNAAQLYCKKRWESVLFFIARPSIWEI